MTSDNDSRFEISSEVRCVSEADGTFVLNRKTGMCFALNAVGLQVWRGIEDGLSICDIIDRIHVAFSSVGPTQIASDVKTFISDLHSQQLIRPR